MLQAGITHINHLCFPDSSEVSSWAPGEQVPTFEIDKIAGSQRASNLENLQLWAGLEPSPDVEMLIFIGRWNMQKGIDIIAEVMPSILAEHLNVQLIFVGPVVDQCGKTAARKLQHLVSLQPDQVYSKPEFTALPQFVFTGSEFALLPARVEPIGLAAIKFGRKGALGIGSRVGSQGQTICFAPMKRFHIVRQVATASWHCLSSPAFGTRLKGPPQLPPTPVQKSDQRGIGI